MMAPAFFYEIYNYLSGLRPYNRFPTVGLRQQNQYVDVAPANLVRTSWKTARYQVAYGLRHQAGL